MDNGFAFAGANANLAKEALSVKETINQIKEESFLEEKAKKKSFNYKSIKHEILWK